jgi:hypothetical protein
METHTDEPPAHDAASDAEDEVERHRREAALRGDDVDERASAPCSDPPDAGN